MGSCCTSGGQTAEPSKRIVAAEKDPLDGALNPLPTTAEVQHSNSLSSVGFAGSGSVFGGLRCKLTPTKSPAVLELLLASSHDSYPPLQCGEQQEQQQQQDNSGSGNHQAPLLEQSFASAATFPEVVSDLSDLGESELAEIPEFEGIMPIVDAEGADGETASSNCSNNDDGAISSTAATYTVRVESHDNSVWPDELSEENLLRFDSFHPLTDPRTAGRHEAFVERWLDEQVGGGGQRSLAGSRTTNSTPTSVSPSSFYRPSFLAMLNAAAEMASQEPEVPPEDGDDEYDDFV